MKKYSKNNQLFYDYDLCCFTEKIKIRACDAYFILFPEVNIELPISNNLAFVSAFRMNLHSGFQEIIWLI